MRGVYTTYDRDYSFVGSARVPKTERLQSADAASRGRHRINDSIYNTALIGTKGWSMWTDIERVELIRGPSSSIYGAGAFFAVINVITKRVSIIRDSRPPGAAPATAPSPAGSPTGPGRRAGPTCSFPVPARRRRAGFLLQGVQQSGRQQRSREKRRCRSEHQGLARVSFGHLTIEAAHSRREKVIRRPPTGPCSTAPRTERWMSVPTSI